MSVKAKIAAGAATFGLVGGGLGMVGTMTASAATTPCGASCTNIFPEKYGPTGFEVDTYQAKAKANQPIILFEPSNSDKAEDFVPKLLGTVTDYYDAADSSESNFTTAFVANYGADPVYDFQYEPYGISSNMCLSTWPGETPQAGYKVRLERCGQYVNALWVSDRTAADDVADARSTAANFAPAATDVPLINGADTSYSDPLVLNDPVGNPAQLPRPILNVQPMNSYASGLVFDNQEWGGLLGVAAS